MIPVHFQVKKQKKGHLIKEGQQNIAYILDKFYWEKPESQVVFLFDFMDAGVSNMVCEITVASTLYSPTLLGTKVLCPG